MQAPWPTYLDFDVLVHDAITLTVGQRLTWRFVFHDERNVAPESRIELKWFATPVPGTHLDAYPTWLRAPGISSYWEAPAPTAGSVRLTGELVPVTSFTEPDHPPDDWPAIAVRIEELQVFSVEYVSRSWSDLREPLELSEEYRIVNELPVFDDPADPSCRPPGRHDLGALVRVFVVAL